MAKEQKPEPVLDDTPEVPEPPKSYRLYIALALVSLVLFQTIVLAVALRTWFPPPKPPNFGLNPAENTGGEFGSVGGVPPGLIKAPPMVEKPINDGEPIVIQQIQGDENVKFSLVMHVRVLDKEQWKFERLHEANKVTVNDRIEAMLSGSTPEERREVGHTAIKAKAMKIINDILGTPYVQEVLITRQIYEVN